MTVDWKPEMDGWGVASETTWLANDQGNSLRAYRMGRTWTWQVTMLSGFTMSGIFAATLGEALEAAEQASHRLLEAQREPPAAETYMERGQP